ncbi:glycosyltransferase [Bacteroides ovatus]|jgi:glycosyltransferase involved in cell wall biosynthesis|uniref:glycosyltransferase n=1 Tax=Bacteroides ovatus TaxID=28116 RepID=UPI002165D1B6|nr:glycosyltransferase [Bacteroides ovatus]MCS2640793.1 glycosyltransferase [Bacteroides ovatus]
MRDNPIISIVVPTRNRYKYLKQFITLVESFKDERIELFVQDNSDDNIEILEFLSNKDLISTKYCYSQDTLSMGGNAERGIFNSTGEYVCFMGDDDGVCRTIADCAQWMKDNDIDAVSPLYMQYSWNEHKGRGMGSIYHEPISNTYCIKDPQQELKKVLSQGVTTFYGCVRLYHAIVKRSALEKVYKVGGNLFPGPTPDISSAVSLSFTVKKYVYLNIPVTIPGMSRMVGGGVMGRVLTLDEVSFITDKDRRDWIEGFPPMWASEIIWPDGALNALKYMGREDFIKYFSKNRMLARLVAVHRKYFNVAFKYADNKSKFLLDFVLYFISEGIKFFGHKVLAKINGRTNGIYITKDGFNSIADAEQYLMEQMKNFSYRRLKCTC